MGFGNHGKFDGGECENNRLYHPENCIFNLLVDNFKEFKWKDIHDNKIQIDDIDKGRRYLDIKLYRNGNELYAIAYDEYDKVLFFSKE